MALVNTSGVSTPVQAPSRAWALQLVRSPWPPASDLRPAPCLPQHWTCGRACAGALHRCSASPYMATWTPQHHHRLTIWCQTDLVVGRQDLQLAGSVADGQGIEHALHRKACHALKSSTHLLLAGLRSVETLQGALKDSWGAGVAGVGVSASEACLSPSVCTPCTMGSCTRSPVFSTGCPLQQTPQGLVLGKQTQGRHST